MRTGGGVALQTTFELICERGRRAGRISSDAQTGPHEGDWAARSRSTNAQSFLLLLATALFADHNGLGQGSEDADNCNGGIMGPRLGNNNVSVGVNDTGTLSQDTLPSPLPIGSLSQYYYSHCTSWYYS